MNKILITLSILFCISHTFSQGDIDEAQNVVVNWKVGTSKKVSQIDSMTVYGNDTIIMSTVASSDYTIKIVSKRDTVYEVLFKQIQLNDIVLVQSDIFNASQVEQMMKELMVELQKRMSVLEYSFLVDQNTALAFEVKNQNKLIESMEEIVVVVLNEFFDKSKGELSKSQRNEIQLTVKKQINEQIPAIIETMLNAFNYVFQAYSFPFIVDKTYRQDVEIYDVNQVQYGDIQNDAELIVNSWESDSELTIDYEYVYDKREAYQMFVIDQGRSDEISIDDFDIDERVISKFDTKTSWIKSCSSFVNAKMGNMIVTNTTHVIIN